MSLQTNVGHAEMPDDHWVSLLGVDLSTAGGEATCRCTILPAMWMAGTQRPSLGVVATIVDVAAGHVPDGPRNPTVDLRVQIIGDAPSQGPVTFVARPKRVGRRLVVSETTAYDEAMRPWAMGTTTFMNRVIEGLDEAAPSRPTATIDSFDDLLPIHIVDERTLDLEPLERLSNGHIGTVQGGVQAAFAERAARHVLPPGTFGVDLDIRYLGPVRTGPLRARATVVGRTGPLTSVRVDFTDAGECDAVVAYVSLLMVTP